MQMRREAARWVAAVAVAGALLGGTVANAVAGAAQVTQQQSVVALPTAWQAGDRLRLELLRERARFEGAAQVGGSATRTAVDLEVRERTPDGYRMRWVWHPASLEGAPELEEQLMAHLSALIGPVAVDVLTDELGTPLAVENLAELVAVNRQALPTFAELLRAQGVPEAQVALTLELTEALLTEDLVAAGAVREAQIFLFAAGGEFPLGQTVPYQDLLANPFGGAPLPSAAWYRLAQVDVPGGSATVEWGQAIDRARAGQILEGIARVLAERAGTPVPPGGVLAAVPLAIDDTGTFVMDTRTGWPRAVRWERTTSAGARRQVERLTFTTLTALTTPPAQATLPV
jgi:hypothetical protein